MLLHKTFKGTMAKLLSTTPPSIFRSFKTRHVRLKSTTSLPTEARLEKK